MNNITKYNDEYLNVIGRIVREYREIRNLSQKQLSDKLLLLGIDIPKNSIQRLERGERTIRDYELAGLSVVLGVPPTKLLQPFIDTLKQN